MLAISVFVACGSDRPRGSVTDAGFVADTMQDVEVDAEVDGDSELDSWDDVTDVFESDGSPDGDSGGVPADTSVPVCGDGLRDLDEECDDGNLSNGDGCSATCTLESCGDGAIAPGLGEECEAGVDIVADCRDLGLGEGTLGCIEDLCRFDVRDCDRGRCGDGEVTGDETCDDDNVLDGDGCSSICFVEACLASNPLCDGGEEVCDGLDNDGDGLVDDHPTDATLGSPCDAGCGDGEWICFGGEIVCRGTEPAAETVCNGRDDECTGEPDGCDSIVSSGETLRRDVVVRSPDVDVLLLLDGSPSMASARASIANRLAEGWWPAGATRVAVATIGDLPIAPLGAPTDRPWVLHRRAATLVSFADELADELNATAASPAGDPALASWPALVHAATGAGFVWPGRPRTPAPSPASLFSVDEGSGAEFEIEVRTGQRVDLEVVAARVGSPLDAILEVYAPGETDIPFARNDDRHATDPALTVIAPADGALRVRITPCCGDVETTTGYGALYAHVNGIPHVVGGAWGACADSSSDPTSNDLIDARAVWPRPAAACADSCVDAGAPAPLIHDFCGDGLPLGRCGNGRVDSGETCDDGDFVVGDGCGADCQLEADRVAPFDTTPGFVPALGHGDRGGFGFAETARPVIAWITDSPAHDTAVWDAIEADLPGAADAAAALVDTGVVPLIIDPSADTAARDAFTPWVVLAGGVTDTCAWDEIPACPEGRCCNGSDGGTTPVDDTCPLAAGGDGATVDVHIDRTIAAATRAPQTLELSIESDVAAAACLIDTVRVTTTADCGPSVVADLDAGRITGLRPGAPVVMDVLTSNRDTRDTDDDGNLTEPCVRSADVSLRIVARDAAGVVFIDEPLTIRVD